MTTLVVHLKFIFYTVKRIVTTFGRQFEKLEIMYKKTSIKDVYGTFDDFIENVNDQASE